MRILVTGSRTFAERYNQFMKDHPVSFVNNATVEPLRLDNLDETKLRRRFFQAVTHADSHGHKEVVFVHGGCPTGVDRLCSEFVRKVSESPDYAHLSIREEVHLADWNKHGKRAGPIRNTEMVEHGPYGHMIAAWDGLKTDGSGTFDCFRKGTLAGIDSVNICATR